MEAGWNRLDGAVTGSQGRLFNLVLVCTLLSVATLGVYSFWMRTRLRRWLWSSVEIGGAPLEYDGRPLEKLIGFVFAAVIVAIWLGLVTMVLIWLSLNLFTSPGPGAAAAFVLLLPIYYWAKYRGLRYVLGHTSWRGLSFWMEPGAVGYAWRALAWGAFSLATLGLAEPARQRALWRYRAERARWGDAPFRFSMPLGSLYRVFAPFAVVLVANAALLGWGIVSAEAGNPGRLAYLLISVPALVFVYVRWRVRAFTLLASGLSLEGGPSLVVAPRTGRVIGIHLLGWLAMGLAIGVAFSVLGGAGGVALAGLDLEGLMEDPPFALIAAGIGVFYVAFFVLRSAFRLVFVTYPLIGHVGATLRVADAAALAGVAQGEGARLADADGFANLFDTGIGI